MLNYARLCPTITRYSLSGADSWTRGLSSGWSAIDSSRWRIYCRYPADAIPLKVGDALVLGSWLWWDVCVLRLGSCYPGASWRVLGMMLGMSWFVLDCSWSVLVRLRGILGVPSVLDSLASLGIGC